jgi:Uma2 family endonuclease
MGTGGRYTPHYTVADYEAWEGDWELWHGIPVAMGPSPFGLHSKILARVITALQNAVEATLGAATVLPELDWIIAADTVVRPDVLIACGSQPERHLTSPPSVVVDVLSDSTRDRDLHHKRRLYEEHGVDYYLILDPDNSQLTVLGRDQENRFAELSMNDGKLSLEICSDCRLTVSVDRIFG